MMCGFFFFFGFLAGPGVKCFLKTVTFLCLSGRLGVVEVRLYGFYIASLE